MSVKGYACVTMIKKKNTWLLVHMEYLFSCSTRHLTRERYRVELSKRNSISTCARGLFSISIAFNLICNNICNRTARKAQFYWIISIVNCAIFLPLMIQTVARTRSNTSDGLFQNPFCLPLASFYLSTGFCVPRRKPSSAKSELLTQNVLSPYSCCYIWIITLRFLSRNF